MNNMCCCVKSFSIFFSSLDKSKLSHFPPNFGGFALSNFLFRFREIYDVKKRKREIFSEKEIFAQNIRKKLNTIDFIHPQIFSGIFEFLDQGWELTEKEKSVRCKVLWCVYANFLLFHTQSSSFLWHSRLCTSSSNVRKQSLKKQERPMNSVLMKCKTIHLTLQ